MGADTKSLRLRIKSVDSTLHLTKAMGLVASSKIRRAGDAMQKARAYASAVKAAVAPLASGADAANSPYLRTDGDRTVLIVIAGDRGLCGGYNANVFRLARQFPDARILPIGKRAFERFGGTLYSSETMTPAAGLSLAQELCDGFVKEEFDRLGIIGTRYVSMMTQEADISWVLPLQKPENAPRSGMIFEPDAMTILNAALPEYVAGLLMAAVRESFASEVAARRMAMDSAGKNAQAMIDELQLAYNRARQGAITQEITEIVAGSGQG
ncbi:MAG: ATP synthase F1 subunit gamma [Clostridia bacterium]|nr:ATP synthase F1 subunit gamma [Clostridia bacterium]